MNRITFAGVVAAFSMVPASAYAYLEEGMDCTFSDTVYDQCDVLGDLVAAQNSGCNPWPDNDANYTYKSERDQPKSSMHYNMTMALAVAAGFSKCAAYAVAMYAQGTDVALVNEQVFWAPLPNGVNRWACSAVFDSEGLNLANGIDSRGRARIPGAWVAPGFTYRSASEDDNNETKRESISFHWNGNLGSMQTHEQVQCTTDTAIDDPAPVPTRGDLLTTWDLWLWAKDGVNTLNQCTAYDDSITRSGGPITRYCPPEGMISPGSLGSLGIFMHSYQDSHSHQLIMNEGVFDHTYEEDNTLDISGFVSNHLAGEFGVLPSTGKPGYGTVNVVTPASPTGFPVYVHSQDTVNAINNSYAQLQGWLAAHPEYKRSSTVKACEPSLMNQFAIEFASIPNSVPASGSASGAKRRSDLADRFFNNANCTW